MSLILVIGMYMLTGVAVFYLAARVLIRKMESTLQDHDEIDHFCDKNLSELKRYSWNKLSLAIPIYQLIWPVLAPVALAHVTNNLDAFRRH